jgi:tight adherence protein C
MALLFENPLLIQVIVFLIVAGFLLAVSALTVRHDHLVEQRIRGLTHDGDRAASTGPGVLAFLGMKFPQWTQTLLPAGAKQRAQLQARFMGAGIYAPWAVSTFIAVRCLLTLCLPAVFVVVAWMHLLPVSSALLGGSLAGILGMVLPHLWLERRRARRHLILRRALPDFLDLIVACLGGGLSVQAALKRVADELKLAHPELTSEMLVVLREVEFGRTLDVALQQLAARTGLEELRMLSSFVHQTTKFGTMITDALQQLAEALRIQREHRAEELAQKAAVKILFPTMIFIFPTIFVVLAGPAAIQIKEGLATANQSDTSAMQSK